MRNRRVPHRLKENKRNHIPRKFVVFDTETIPEDHGGYETHRFRIGVGYYFNTQRGFSDNPTDKIITQDPFELWDWIVNKTYRNERLWVFAHNADFDMSASRAYEYFESNGWELIRWIVEDRMFHLRFRKDKRTIVISDTFSLFPMSLSKIGEWAGIPKMTMPEWNDPDDKWIEYCENDVRVLSLALLRYFKFLKEHDLGNFCPTISSQAFAAYRHRFMKTPIYIHHFPTVENAEIESYYGGRTEAWFIGRFNGVVYDLDVNSMYPFVMKYFEYPVRFIGELDNPSVCELAKLVKKFCVIAHIQVNTDLPILPYRAEKTIFPVGRFSGWYATPEIELALEKNVIEKVVKAYIYEKANIFAEYVDFFYAMKQTAKEHNDTFSYTMAKLFLNSLYGKFGQRVEELKEITDGDLSDEEFDETIVSTATGRIHVYHFMGKKYIKERKEPSFNSFIAIASHVTSYARAYLWRLIEKAGIENVLYMDTDSLFVSEEGYRRLQDEIDEYQLGKLKLEKVGEDVEIYGAKNYRFGCERKIKGVPKSAHQIDETTYEYLHFMRFRTKLRKGLLNQQVAERVIKRLRSKYDKGIVMANGRVIPLQVSEQRPVYHQ